MKYYPIEDPVSHLNVLRVDKTYSDIHVFVNGKLSGILRVANVNKDTLLGNVFAGKRAVVEIDDSLISWHADYTKDIVISRAGEIVRVKDLEHRDE